MCERERLQERLSALKNQVTCWLNIYFPEFTTVFKDWSKQAAWLTLRHFSTPQKVVDAGIPEILRAWGEEMKRPSLKKAEQLCLVASQSVGRTEGTKASISNLQFLMTEYELITIRLESLKEQMAECLSQIPMPIICWQSRVWV